jgi:hypothetical protein
MSAHPDLINGGCPGYDDLKQLSHDLRRPVSTLIALSANNDPFYAGMAGNQAAAEWFAALWQEHCAGQVRHLRRAHYVLYSQPAGVVLMLDGAPYDNTETCWKALAQGSKHARYLELVDPDSIIDRRNPEPLLFAETQSFQAHPEIEAIGKSWSIPTSIEFPEFPDFPDPPYLALFAPDCTRVPVLTEIWVEKSGDLDDVLLPICQRRRVNLVPCLGEQGQAACRNVVARARAFGGPVRVLYLSDFDPAGESMPLAVARKIEFQIRTHHPDLDIQVRPIALTYEQCVEFELPRKPIKDTERRGRRFEERHGEGATELDALEALQPGALRRIVEDEIGRYRPDDSDVKSQISEVSEEVEQEIDQVRETVLARHEDSLDDLRAEHEAIRQAHEQLHAEHERVSERLAEWAERVREKFAEITEDLDAEKPDPTAWEWPDPIEPDEDPDPLFDSRRGYVEQIDRYKAHQGKPTERRGRKNGAAS